MSRRDVRDGIFDAVSDTVDFIIGIFARGFCAILALLLVGWLVIGLQNVISGRTATCEVYETYGEDTGMRYRETVHNWSGQVDCDGRPGANKVFAARAPAAAPSPSRRSSLGNRPNYLGAPVATPTPTAPPADVRLPGVFPVSVDRNDFNIPEDYMVKNLRFADTGTLTLRGLLQAGPRCVDGLEVSVELTRDGAPFTAASTTVSAPAGGVVEVEWDMQVTFDSYEPEMGLKFYGIWLYGSC